MSKVYSFHVIALKAGVSGPDFERFYREDVKSAQTPSGVKERLL